MNRFKPFSVNRWLTGFLCLSLLASLLTSSSALLLRAAAQNNGALQRGGKLGANLPDLAGVRNRPTKQPSAPNFTSTSNSCFDCKTTSVSDDTFSQARMHPLNRTGQSGVDLLSRNIHWSQSVINVKGRAGLGLNLSLIYNSLVWTKAGSQIAFDADRGQPSPGFRLGFPTIQRRYRDGQSGAYAYLLITPEGGRVELRQVAKTNVYEATDNSLLQMIDHGADGALLLRADGTQLSFGWAGGQLQCTEVKDRNGNYLTVDYDKRGHLNSITDTLGRTFMFTRDKGGNLLSIRQKSSGPDKRVLATFGYSDLVVQTNFPGLKVVGPSSGSTITVLTQVGLPDGTHYQFDYASSGQVQRITLIADDGHTLAYTAYNLPIDTTLGLADCPRVTEMRSWAENANNDKETLTRFDSDPNYEWGRATLPDGSTRKEFFGITGWQRGLSLRVEESTTNVELQRVKSTEWSQQPVDNSDFYRTVPRSRDVVRIKANGSQQRTRTEFNGYGLAQDQYDYQADGVAVSQHTHVEYNLDQGYLARHIIGLIRERTTYDASGALISKTIPTYDLPDSILDQGAAVQHDNTAYGTNSLSGRGLLSAISHWDSRHPDKTGETRIGYNTTGSIAFTRNSSGQQTNVTYDDNFSDQKRRSTLAFPTAAVHPDGSRTLTQYDYDTGKVARNQSAKGEIQSFTYDLAGRLTTRKDEKTGGVSRRVYDESGTLVGTFQKVNANTREFGRYTVYDGARRPRALAFDPLTSAQGYRGVYINRDVMGRHVNHSKPTKMNSSWDISGPPVSLNMAQPPEQASGAQLMISELKGVSERLLSGLNDLVAAVEPTASAQSCNEYYETCEEDDPYGNDWFYGGEWGQDYYWDWTDFCDALIWGNSDYWQSSDWDTLSYLAQLSDAEFEAQWQLSDAGLLSYAMNWSWNGHGYEGDFPLWVYDSLISDDDFAHGTLYGFHTDVGRNLTDFRSYTGTFGNGSLQIVMDRNTGHFYADVDRFNPYQDVINAFGHVFGEVLPNLFRRIFP